MNNNILLTDIIICKDINDNDCKIGDKVIISEPPSRIYNKKYNSYIISERKYYEGTIMLSLENGYYLKGDNIHFQPPKHGSPSNMGGTELWEWKRL